MNRYLIHHNGKGRIVDVDDRAMTADDFGRMQQAFATEARGGRPPKDVYDTYADMLPLYPHAVACGLPYHEEICSASGASFVVVAGPDATPEQVKAAKEYIRRAWDVVQLSVLRYEAI